MKEKSQIEKKAEARQAELLSAALSGASNAGGHWLNVSGKGFPGSIRKGLGQPVQCPLYGLAFGQ